MSSDVLYLTNSNYKKPECFNQKETSDISETFAEDKGLGDFNTHMRC